jgi:hypothetical protein
MHRGANPSINRRFILIYIDKEPERVHPAWPLIET